MTDLAKAYSGRRVAVTGGGGFVGSHLVRLLVKSGAKVVVLDKDPKPWRLEDLMSSIEIVPFDLERFDEARDAVAAVKADTVFHLAAYGVQSRDRDVTRALAINVAGSVAVVEGAAAAKTELIVQIGTSHEYGGSPKPLSEDSPLRPAGMYGATKAAGMILGRTRASELGLRWLGLRPFVVFGPGADEENLIPYMITRALRGLAVLTTAGDQVRDLLYIEDAVAWMAALATAVKTPGIFVNVASGKGVHLREVMETVRRLMPEGEFQFGARTRRDDDVDAQVADVTELREYLQRAFSQLPLDEGLRRTTKFYRERVSSELQRTSRKVTGR